jgi:hypothetical protein
LHVNIMHVRARQVSPRESPADSIFANDVNVCMKEGMRRSLSGSPKKRDFTLCYSATPFPVSRERDVSIVSAERFFTVTYGAVLGLPLCHITSSGGIALEQHTSAPHLHFAL